jgi:hypothetical protein
MPDLSPRARHGAAPAAAADLHPAPGLHLPADLGADLSQPAMPAGRRTIPHVLINIKDGDMIGFLIFAIIVIIMAVVIDYVIGLLLSMLPGLPAQIHTLVRIVIVLIALLAILQRGLPLIGYGSLL